MEQLISHVLSKADISRQPMRDKHVEKSMFPAKCFDHASFFDPQNLAIGDRECRFHPQGMPGERRFTEKFLCPNIPRINSPPAVDAMVSFTFPFRM
jgi:hypothetical protein